MPPVPQFPGQSQTLGAPKTRAELEALIERRDELKGQLESANHRRSILADQVERLGSSPEVRAEPVARLKATDQRITQLEKDLSISDELIVAAKARGLANEEHEGGPVHIDVPALPTIPEIHYAESAAPRTWQDRAMDSFGTTLPITLASVLLLGTFLYWRVSRAMKHQFSQLIATQSGRLEELQRSIDTVAVEVERVSENQRFVTKLVGDKAPAQVVERR